jgi:hypothetical protein
MSGYDEGRITHSEQVRVPRTAPRFAALHARAPPCHRALREILRAPKTALFAHASAMALALCRTSRARNTTAPSRTSKISSASSRRAKSFRIASSCARTLVYAPAFAVNSRACARAATEKDAHNPPACASTSCALASPKECEMSSCPWP